MDVNHNRRTAARAQYCVVNYAFFDLSRFAEKEEDQERFTHRARRGIHGLSGDAHP
jgi:hypothetical protein